MAYRAAALATLLRQVNEIHPVRDTKSDGWIGDASHSARPSDHNPDPPVTGVVRAQDFDADGADGFDLDGWLWDELLRHRDSRISYLISRGRMVSSYAARGYEPWEVRPYHGTNGHFTHLHVSVNKSGDRDARQWRLANPFVVTPTDFLEEIMASPEARQAFAAEVARQVWGATVKDDRVGMNGPASLVLGDVFHHSRQGASAATAAAKAAGVAVDEQAIVSGVLAGLSPEAIAAAIPADLADRVIDALGTRIKGGAA